MHKRRDEHSARECQWMAVMEHTGVTHVYEHYETEGSSFDSFNFHQDVAKQDFSRSKGQRGGSHLRSKNESH